MNLLMIRGEKKLTMLGILAFFFNNYYNNYLFETCFD